ncbi:hypothetical protein, partial [Cupriavidus basilensis]|uniref:hypothetical protein n=1 Tax=Cupriavidus basilensis TaxID=68895 RepID=UPI001C2D0438
HPLELFQRVVTVSLETMKIVWSLPRLDIQQPGPDGKSKHAVAAPALTVVADGGQQEDDDEVEQGVLGPDGVPCAIVDWDRSRVRAKKGQR